ncbi:MAG TPA: glycosyltransferase family 2 protein [Candidatus Magasanikbacteria bacterium]|nr:glycosyltransferase family 2 protein [Candidatus Magasanikbacteria bacterium]
MESSKIAILLLNWNGFEETTACIDSLIVNKTSFVFDIYVVDNRSRGDDYERLQKKYQGHENIFLVKSEKNLGFTGGNNLLIQEAKNKKDYQYYFLLNNDTELPEDFLQKLMDAVGGRKGIFGPQVRYFEQKGLIQSIGGNINLWTGICSRIGDKVRAEELTGKNTEATVDYIFGCAFLISKEVVDVVGVLDEKYFIYYEEVDYCVSARKYGFDVKYVPVETVYHKDSVTTRKISGFHIYMMFRNRVHFLKRHSSWLQFLVSCVYVALYLPYFALKYGIHEARFLAKGTLDGFKGKVGDPTLYGMF